MESILQKRTHPLLKAKLVTGTVAEKIGMITCADYMKFSDEELIRFLKSHNVGKYSITICVKKRNKYIEMLGK